MSPIDEYTFVLKPLFLLKHEADNSENVMCHSIIDYYIDRPHAIKHIFLPEFVSKYKKNGTHISKRKKPNVIRFFRYNKHIDYENYCREKLLLYVPFENNENVLKHNFPTWKDAYVLHEDTIRKNEAIFTYNINPMWGYLENIDQELEDSTMEISSTVTKEQKTKHCCEEYDLKTDLQCSQHYA